MNHTSIWILALSVFVVFVRILLNVNLSLNHTLLTFLFYLSQTWKTQLIQAIFLWGVIFLLICMGLISRSLCGCLCFWLALLYSLSHFFFLVWSSSSSLHMVFGYIWSNIDEILFIDPLATHLCLSLQTLTFFIRTG